MIGYHGANQSKGDAGPASRTRAGCGAGPGLGRANSQDFLGSGVPTVRHRSGGNVTNGRYFVCYRHELCSRPHPYRLSNKRKLVDPNHVLLSKYPSIVAEHNLLQKPLRGLGGGHLYQKIYSRSLQRALGDSICSRKSTPEASREL